MFMRRGLIDVAVRRQHGLIYRSLSSTTKELELKGKERMKRESNKRLVRVVYPEKKVVRKVATPQDIEARPKVTVVEHAWDHKDLLPQDVEVDLDKLQQMPKAFAVVGMCGTQHKVVKGDVIVADKLADARVGEEYILNDVLLIGMLDKTLIGRPLIDGAQVKTICEEITRDKKVIVFKKRRRTNRSKTTHGFRRDVTLLRVKDIIIPSELE